MGIMETWDAVALVYGVNFRFSPTTLDCDAIDCESFGTFVLYPHPVNGYQRERRYCCLVHLLIAAKTVTENVNEAWL